MKVNPLLKPLGIPGHMGKFRCHNPHAWKDLNPKRGDKTINVRHAGWNSASHGFKGWLPQNPWSVWEVNRKIVMRLLPERLQEKEEKAKEGN